MRHVESQNQQLAVTWFRSHYPEYENLFFSVPNGGKRGETEAKILVGEGMTKGVSDTLLLVPSKGFHGLCVEFKKISYFWDEHGKEHYRKSGQEKEQKEWQKAVEKQGYKYAIVYSYYEFIELIEDYLGKSKL